MRELNDIELDKVDGGSFAEGLAATAMGAAAGARVGGYAGVQGAAIGTLAGAVIGLALYLI